MSAGGLNLTPKVGSKLVIQAGFSLRDPVWQSTRIVIEDYNMLTCGGFSWKFSDNYRTTFNYLQPSRRIFRLPEGLDYSLAQVPPMESMVAPTTEVRLSTIAISTPSTMVIPRYMVASLISRVTVVLTSRLQRLKALTILVTLSNFSHLLPMS